MNRCTPSNSYSSGFNWGYAVGTWRPPKVAPTHTCKRCGLPIALVGKIWYAPGTSFSYWTQCHVGEDHFKLHIPLSPLEALMGADGCAE